MASRTRAAFIVVVLVGRRARRRGLPRRRRPLSGVLGREESGSIGDSRINEVSGVVASRAHRRMSWIEEDSGNGPWVYAIRPTGGLEADIEVDGASNRDWEDMAADVGKDGVVIKNYSSALLFPWRSTRVIRTLRRSTPCPVALPASESVAFSLSGHRIYSIPEGRDPEISYVGRR